MPRIITALFLTLTLAVGLPVPAGADHPEYPGPVHIGDSGSNVETVQNAVGAAVDGDFGPLTQTAVRDWQQSAGLLDTGWVGPVTWAALFGQHEPPQTIVFEGSGWGHGIGMSQYGARGMAASGSSYSQILGYFYTGASVATLAQAVGGTSGEWISTVSDPVWVNILDEVAGLTFEPSAGSLVFCQNEPDVMDTIDLDSEPNGYIRILEQRLSDLGYDPGPVDQTFTTETDAAVRAFQTDEGLQVDGRVGSGTRGALWPADGVGETCFIEVVVPEFSLLTVTADAAGCQASGVPVVGGCRASIRSASGGRLSGGNHVRVLDLIDSPYPYRAYADGYLRIRPATPTTFHVVHQTDLDHYVTGVAEVPASWPAESLKAQAVAARSFAAASMRNVGPESGFSVSRKLNCWCQLYSTVQSQVYVGYTRTQNPDKAGWISAANATAGQVLDHPSAGLVQAFYSSSTGGRTQNNEDRWGGSPVPYLRSVSDPWSLDARVNSKAVWTHTRTAASVASALGLDELLSIHVASRHVSGGVAVLRTVGVRAGETVVEEWSIGSVVGPLALPGRYFNVGWPTPAEGPIPFVRQFTDIAGSIHAQDIDRIAELGITKGCNPPANDRYCPTQRVTRGQIAAFLNRALLLPGTSEDFFTDDAASVFEDDINRLAAAGITTGCGNGRYCPDDPLTRGQMAALLRRALGLPAGPTGRFVDDNSSIFEADIEALAAVGITKGCNPPANDRFCPDGNVTRQEMASFLVRSLAYLSSQP